MMEELSMFICIALIALIALTAVHTRCTLQQMTRPAAGKHLITISNNCSALRFLLGSVSNVCLILPRALYTLLSHAGLTLG